jgi:hypothetical protein
MINYVILYRQSSPVSIPFLKYYINFLRVPRSGGPGRAPPHFWGVRASHWRGCEDTKKPAPRLRGRASPTRLGLAPPAQVFRVNVVFVRPAFQRALGYLPPAAVTGIHFGGFGDFSLAFPGGSFVGGVSFVGFDVGSHC